MFAKLLAIIATVALAAAALLVLRHQRLEAAHELATIDREMTRHQHDLWELRTELSERTSTKSLQELLQTLPNDWQAIPGPPPNAQPEVPQPRIPDLVIHEKSTRHASPLSPS